MDEGESTARRPVEGVPSRSLPAPVVVEDFGAAEWALARTLSVVSLVSLAIGLAGVFSLNDMLRQVFGPLSGRILLGGWSLAILLAVLGVVALRSRLLSYRRKWLRLVFDSQRGEVLHALQDHLDVCKDLLLDLKDEFVKEKEPDEEGLKELLFWNRKIRELHFYFWRRCPSADHICDVRLNREVLQIAHDHYEAEVDKPMSSISLNFPSDSQTRLYEAQLGACCVDLLYTHLGRRVDQETAVR